MHEINQQAGNVEITFVCPKSWHSVLKRKKKAQMSFHQRTYLCGKKRGGGDRKSRRHTTFLLVPPQHFHRPPLCPRLSQVARPNQCWRFSATFCSSFSPHMTEILTSMYTWPLWISFPGQVGDMFRILREGEGDPAEICCGPFGTIPWTICSISVLPHK